MISVYIVACFATVFVVLDNVNNSPCTSSSILERLGKETELCSPCDDAFDSSSHVEVAWLTQLLAGYGVRPSELQYEEKKSSCFLNTACNIYIYIYGSTITTSL
jgi:hypothetical protein